MKRIRSKLVLALLVVSLIPVLPSYYMANGLVNYMMSLGFNDTVEQAIGGAVSMAGEVHHYYEIETIGVAKDLAHSDRVRQLLNPDRRTAGGEIEAGQIDLNLPPSYHVEIYDAQARLVASQAQTARAEKSTGHVSVSNARRHTNRIEHNDAVTVDFDVDLSEVLTALLETDREADLRFYRDSLAVMATKTTVETLSGLEDPRLISILAPVSLAPVEEAVLGFMVVTRLLPEEHGRTTRQLSGLQEIFQAIDEHRAQIQMGVRVVFWVFYVMVAAFALIVGYLLSRRLTRPLLALVDGTQKVAAGDLDYRLNVASKDEIGQLMASFNKMITQIKVNQRLAAQREAQRQKMEDQHQARVKDLEVAEMRERALQAENDRQTLELEKTQELEQAYQKLEESHQTLQETQAQLLLNEKMASLGGLVAGVAHEINNPMGAVHSAVDVSQRCAERIEQQLSEATSLEQLREAPAMQRPLKMLADNLGVIGQAAQRIVTLVQGLKNFARIDEAQMQIADLAEGIDSALVLLQPQLPPGVIIQRELGNIPRTWCAPAQLNQVFMNVLTNAVTAVGNEGHIEITSEVEGESIRVRICDDGVGMSQQQLESIFDLQFRSGTTRVKMGSGLSMAYRIMQEHDGEILVESKLGEGTQVMLRIPVRCERPSASAEVTP